MKSLASLLPTTVLALGMGVLATPAARADDLSDPLAALDEVTPRIAEKVLPSVVLLDVERTATTKRPLSPIERLGLGVSLQLPGYFDRPAGPVTAVCVAPGLVATTCWNVDGQGEVTAILPSGDRVPARRLGRDENLDLALFAVDAPGLVPLAPSTEAPRVGRFLFLIARTGQGAPLVTSGIVSGLGRHRGDAFAHSARTSYQSVGGALVDLDGKLVGIAVRHNDRAPQGQSSGVAFGVPAGAMTKGLDRMARGEVVERRKSPLLGIVGDQTMTEGGVKVAQVMPGSGAAAAGVKVGDIIKIFNTVELRNFMHLREEIEKLAVGEEIVITVRRGDEDLDIRAKLGVRTGED